MALVNDTKAPDFELANQFGEHVRLSDFLGKKPVTLVFFPLSFSSTCTSELCTLRDNLALFKQNGVELIGISVDSKATLRSFAEQEGYDFTLLADADHAVAEKYGAWVEKSMYGKKYMGVQRATFIIGPDGKIAKVFPKVQPKKHDDLMLKALAELSAA